MPGHACTVAICTAQTLFTQGGAELHVSALERELKERGHAVEVVKLPFTWTKADLLQNALVWRLINVEADLVIATNFPSYFVKHNNKTVWLFHQHRKLYELYGTPFSEFGNDPADEEIRRIIAGADTRCISEAQRIFTTSRNVSERLKKFNNLIGEPLYHPPPLYRSLFCQEYGDFILMPTRLEAHKRPELFVEAMRLSRSGVRGVIAGRGPLEMELRRQIERYGMDGRIEVVGYVEEPELLKLYACCLAAFYAPYDEDYGYVTLEAFYAKKPVITTTDSGGVLEFVTDGQTGIVSKPDPEAIAQKIDQLAESRERCKRLGEAGYEKVKSISWDEVIRRLVEGVS